MPESPEPTALYRMFDKQERLLYIGISKNPDGRWKAHRDNREPWVGQVASRTVEWHDSRALALKAEAEAISAERPRFNGKHNYDDVDFDPLSWSPVEGFAKVPSVVELMRREILNGRWPAGYRIPPLRTLSKAAGVSMRIASKASVALQGEGLLIFDSGNGLFVAPRSTTQ